MTGDTAPANPITVMSAIALKVAFERGIAPAFEAAGAARLDFTWEPTTVLMQQIEDGRRADVVVLIDDAMDRLVERGIVRVRSRMAVARAMLGVGIRAGAAHPDLSTPAAFKQALVGADGVAYSRAGASGIYFAGLIERLGIAAAMRPVVIPAGFTAEKVMSGEAELAIQQTSELMSVPGIEIAGLFPEEFQVMTDFSAAMFEGAVNPQGAERFLEAIAPRRAASAYRAGGLQPRLPAANRSRREPT